MREPQDGETVEKTGVSSTVSHVLAEREGFEPSVGGIPLRRFSKAVLSATQPPLRPRTIDGNYIL